MPLAWQDGHSTPSTIASSPGSEIAFESEGISDHELRDQVLLTARVTMDNGVVDDEVTSIAVGREQLHSFGHCLGRFHGTSLRAEGVSELDTCSGR